MLLRLCLLLVSSVTGLRTSTRSGSPPYFGAEWSGGRMAQPTCVDIPANLTLCHNIGYTQMRLPNLLDHDTMAEVSQQAVSWVPLFNLKCHADTQLFLCSLFSPVCLDRLIYPCRSLCEAVRSGCEGRMKAYGFPWPDMVRCDKFPMDNDMCIRVQSHHPTGSPPCTVCNQPETYENIIDNFCRADFVIKTKVRRTKKSQLRCRKSKIFKSRAGLSKKDLRRPTLQRANLTECCGTLLGTKKPRLLIMGARHDNDLVPTFIMEWGKNRVFKKALKDMRTIDCTSPKLLSESLVLAKETSRK